MPTIDFTVEGLKKLSAPPGERIEYRSRRHAGLTLRVSGPTAKYPAGRKIFSTVYRFGAEQQRDTYHPPYPELNLTEAIKYWRRTIAAVETGTNPAAVKRERRLGKPKKQLQTVATALAEYTREKSDQWSNNHRIGVMHDFDAYILPKLGRYPLTSITRDDVRELLQEIIDSGKGRTTNHVQTTLTTFFNWTVDEAQYLTASPLQGLKRKFRETARDNTLTDDGLTAVLAGARRLPYPYGPYVQALIGTGQRRTEIAKMRASNISGGVLTIPGADTKNRKAHRVPLPPFVLAVLDDARREVEENIRRHCTETGRPIPEVAPGFDYIFGGRYKGSFTAFSLCKRMLDAAIEAFSVETGLPVPEDWRFHDLRRTCGSVLARLGVPSATIGRLMNHMEKGITAKVYITHSYEREIGDALKLWSDHLTRLERGIQLVSNVA
jgi:integrase